MEKVSAKKLIKQNVQQLCSLPKLLMEKYTQKLDSPVLFWHKPPCKSWLSGLPPFLAVNAAVSHHEPMMTWRKLLMISLSINPSFSKPESSSSIRKMPSCFPMQLTFYFSPFNLPLWNVQSLETRSGDVQGTATMLSNVSQQPPSPHLASVHAAIAVRVQVTQGVSDGTKPWWIGMEIV